MSSLLVTELATTCSALGYFDANTNKYVADENVIETLKDLIRYLRRDDENHEVRVQLGKIKVVQTDLLPLLKTYWEQPDIFDILLRLIVNLTTPPLILFNEEIPTHKTLYNVYLQIEDHLQCYKESFTEDTIWAILSTKLSKILELEYAERGDENSLIIERILILVRNILYVPSNPDQEQRPDHDANLHDQVLWTLRQAGMLDIILYIAGSQHEQVYYMHILEILSFMLREQSAEKLGSSVLERNHIEKLQDEAELLAIRHQEMNQKKQKMRAFTGARHSRFGGTYVVKSMKGIGDNDLIYHKPLSALDKLNFDMEKRKTKVPKNRQPIRDVPVERNSAFSVRLFLKDFCIEFLNGAYNTLMKHVKNMLSRAKAQAHDESYYLWALRFFMEFNRAYSFDVKLISETMSIQTFHFVQQQMENYFDMLSSDKKRLKLWSKRLHLALLAYKELLLTVATMDKSTDTNVVQSAKVIKSNIFYVIEYRELILTLLITYDELKMSQTYLKDLIETQHVYIRMLQKFCEKYGSVVVAEKTKKKRKKKSKPPAEQNTDTLDSRWDEISSELTAVLSGTLGNVDVVPFDGSSDVPINDQKAEAMKRIQRSLWNWELDVAVALLRASRGVWPDNDTFGANSIPFEEEYLILHEIFFANLGQQFKPDLPITPQSDQEDNEDEEEEDGGYSDYQESVIKFDDFAKRLAHPKIVRACGLCLRNFVKNLPYTNLCAIKLLHRIAFDYKMYVMVFQASIFRTFQKIFELKHMPQYKELVRFATYIMKQFFTVAAVNPKVYIEVLFWKSSKDAFDIEHGYGTYHQKSAASARGWTELEEQELRTLFEEHQRNQIEQDVVDWIIENLIKKDRTRKAVIKKLKEIDLLVNYKAKPDAKKRNAAWTVNDENELKELYEEYKEADDPLACIMENLSISRPKNRVIEKMLVMGLIQDKADIKKKRKKSRKNEHVGDVATTSKKAPKKKVNKKIRNFTAVSSSELKHVLRDLLNKDFDDALKWISESLIDAAEDLKTADIAETDGIPLVPLQEACETALENTDFKKLLRACGMSEPMDEQEIYWRISSTASPSYLRECGTLISQALEFGIIDVQTVNGQNDENSADDEDSGEESDNQEHEENMPFTEFGNETHSNNGDADANLSNTDIAPFESRNASEGSDSSESEITKAEAQDMNKENIKPRKLSKKKRIFTADTSEDSADEGQLLTVQIDVASSSGEKRDRFMSDSDEDKPKRKKKKILSSDEE